MSISEFFKRLGAPLHNIVWSWGAVAEDGTVILRCWSHEVRIVEEKYQYIVLDDAYSRRAGGYSERVRHLQLISDKAEARIVIVTHVDAKNPQGKIGHFNSGALMKVTRLFKEGETTYVECEGIEQLRNGYRNV